MSKLVFAHQLRGIAALLIVITHYFGVYYGAQNVVAMLSASPELHLVAPAWVPWMDFPILKGPFGVAVFFLISGFVIPFSLQKHRADGFLLARAFRIYPTYITCLAIGLAAVALSALYWHTSFALDWRRIGANALLVHNLIGYDTFDAVNWTLAIELKFYLLAAACAPVFLQRKPVQLAVIAAALIGLNLLRPHAAALSPMLHALSTDLNYVLFMLIGVLFSQHYRGLLSGVELGASAAGMLAAFILAWWLSGQHDQVIVLAQYYVYALIVFGLCYALRERFRPLRVLDFLADISYPLYAIHPLVGYTLMKVLMQEGMPFGPASCVALASALALAWLVHIGVENRSNAWGKRLAAAV